ncbi:MAG: riboflavin synthase [Candidatus Magasanikbacteria bacterium]
MFTGIVKSIGIIKEIKPKGDGYFFSIGTSLLEYVAIGSSLAVGGVCLTVCEKEGDVIKFEIMPETLRKTILESKKEGDSVNIEPSLKIGDEVGGHFVYGHVDGVGKVLEIAKDGDGVLVSIEPPKNLMKYIAPQGSIAVDGVSLTIAQVNKDSFMVSLVSYTLVNTTLGKLEVGGGVNIETDMLAKYLERIKNYEL